MKGRSLVRQNASRVLTLERLNFMCRGMEERTKGKDGGGPGPLSTLDTVLQQRIDSLYDDVSIKFPDAKLGSDIDADQH